MTPPSSSHMSVYWPRPGPISSMSLVSTRASASRAPGPDTSSWPMWETSKTPDRSRTARCSARAVE